MSTMYGADVAQLRALASRFESTAGQLDSLRAVVARSVQASPWSGPSADQFRAAWSGQHSAAINAVVRSLRDGAGRLRSNADGQERTSSVNGASAGATVPGLVTGGGGGSNGWLNGISAVWGGAHFASDVYGIWTMPAGIAKVATAARVLAKTRGATSSLKAMTNALKLSEAYKTVDKAGDIIGLGKTAGKVMGVAGIVFDVVDTVQYATKGDVGHAVISGAHAVLGAVSLVPGPVGLVATGANILLTVGVFAYDHRKEIADFANGATKAVTKTASQVAHAVGEAANAAGKAAKGFVDGMAKAAKSLWPF